MFLQNLIATFAPQFSSCLTKGHGRRHLLVTSAVPNEGKSTISANLAITMALSGAKTLLIDGDLRRGALAGSFRHPLEDWFFRESSSRK